MNNINKNYEYFKKSLSSLIKDHYNQYVVIKNQKVIAVYSELNEAYKETVKTEKLGTFLIQHCVNPGEEVAYFASGNVYFPYKVLTA